MALLPTFHDVSVNTTLGNAVVHYVEAGSKHNPTLLLLHGFPSSSYQFRGLIPLLSDTYHILAPDLPGFGHTEVPNNFTYTFENLSIVIAQWIFQMQLEKIVLYLFDYGAPVGWRLAVQNSGRIQAIISQNGNAYNAGFGQDFWAPIFALWNTSDSTSARQTVRDNVLTLKATEDQYMQGVPEIDRELLDPNSWTLDYLQNIAGKKNQETQLDLFYDYRKNVEYYPRVHEYFRASQVPLLAAWGSGDPAFIPAGADAFKKDLPNAVVRFLDTGHFALETKRTEIARIIRQFLTNLGI